MGRRQGELPDSRPGRGGDRARHALADRGPLRRHGRARPARPRRRARPLQEAHGPGRCLASRILRAGRSRRSADSYRCARALRHPRARSRLRSPCRARALATAGPAAAATIDGSPLNIDVGHHGAAERAVRRLADDAVHAVRQPGRRRGADAGVLRARTTRPSTGWSCRSAASSPGLADVDARPG